MKISIRLCPEGVPKAVHQEYNAKDLDMEFVDLAYLDKIVLDGMVEKLKDTLTFQGFLKSRVEHTCARCLQPVQETVDHPFDMVYDVSGKEELDTLDDLRDVLILDHPIRFLCREDCKGLCPHCGADLNKEVCSCSQQIN